MDFDTGDGTLTSAKFERNVVFDRLRMPLMLCTDRAPPEPAVTLRNQYEIANKANGLCPPIAFERRSNELQRNIVKRKKSSSGGNRSVRDEVAAW